MNLSTTQITLFAIALIVLLSVNAVFVATEFSLVKLRFTRFGTGRMKVAKERKSIAAMLGDIGQSMKIIRLGIAMCTIGIGFLLAPLGVELSLRLGWESDLALRASVLLSFALAVALHYTLGELVPRALALHYPVEALRVSVPVYQFFRFFAKPLANGLNAAAGVLLKLLRLDPSLDLNALDVEAQIRSLVSEGEELPELAENIVHNVLELRKRVAHDIMIPRNQLKYLDTRDSLSENLKEARESGHTRFPLCDGDLDHCAGIIHIKDVFRSGLASEDVDFDSIKRPILRFNMDDPLESVMQSFLKQKKHFALLIDDFGGTVGAITLEDVLEELVGEIQDEFDRDLDLVVELGDGAFLVDGLTPLHDVAVALGVELSASEVSTVGGYLTLELGRMPKPKEVFRAGPLEVTAENLDERRIIAATVRVASPVSNSDQPS